MKFDADENSGGEKAARQGLARDSRAKPKAGGGGRTRASAIRKVQGEKRLAHNDVPEKGLCAGATGRRSTTNAAVPYSAQGG